MSLKEQCPLLELNQDNPYRAAHQNLFFVYMMNKGKAAEHLAVAALLINGYEVFLNVSPNGHSDLIAMKNRVRFRVQVKSFHTVKRYRFKVAECRMSSHGKPHREYTGLIDMMAYVDCETGEVFTSRTIPKRQVAKTALADNRIFPL